MPTTTNFGWTTPADTDLVKDGASAIRTLGNGIDTSFLDLKGGTSGQYLTKNSNTDLDFAWVTLNAGGMTLISTTTLSGASTTLSSIPGTYNNLVLHIRNFRPATNNQSLRFYFNADNGANRYYTNSGTNYNTTGGNVSFNSTQISTGDDTSSTTNNGEIYITISDYANTATWKTAEIITVSSDGTTPTLLRRILSYGTYNQTGAISSITFLSSSGNLSAGSVLLYGVK